MDESLRLEFSADTLTFDTVFSGFGTSTQCVMVYNRNRNAVRISDVFMDDGHYFALNLDGENDLGKLHDLTLDGGDSLYLFVRAIIDPLNVNTPVYISDTIRFIVNGNVQSIMLEAVGQNVTVIRSENRRVDYADASFSSFRPYLIFDTLIVQGNADFEPGATLYMHSGALLYICGDVTANGTLERPIRVLPDRTDKLFEHVPYRVASGQWGGVFLMNYAQSHRSASYSMKNVDILSGNIGLYCYSESDSLRGRLRLENARIHNHAVYGVVLQNTDAVVLNSEISNCAAYCLYLSGGKDSIVHTTIASYFGTPNSDLNIHTVHREDVAAVYIENISKEKSPTQVYIFNSIITGVRSNNLLLATPLISYYTGEIAGSYLKADTISAPWCHDNVYATDSDSVFVNIFYKYKEYKYYDFRLDSLSPAIGIGDSVIGLRYPYDKLGNRRSSRPCAGCYER